MMIMVICNENGNDFPTQVCESPERHWPLHLPCFTYGAIFF